MPKYSSELTFREEVAEGTMAFHFNRPNGFEFKPGQHIDITLLNASQTDDEGNMRTFSLAGAPFEKDLMITTRIRATAFKREITTVELPYAVQIEGPFGSMTLPQNSTRSLVMLAGGIGITPFLSMIRQAQHDNRAGEMFLFYSNRRLEDAPYFVELQQIAQNYPNLKFVPTMTDVTNSAQPWTGETGYITAEMLAKYLGDLNIPNFFIAGPPTMVFAIGQMLNKAGVIDDNVRTEDFAGY